MDGFSAGLQVLISLRARVADAGARTVAARGRCTKIATIKTT